MKYTILATSWIVILLYSKEHFNTACVCAVVHLLSCVGYEIEQLTKKLIEQKKESSEQLLRTLESVSMELIKQRK